MPLPYYVSPEQVMEGRGSMPAFVLNVTQEV